jgi:hypothetical protein
MWHICSCVYHRQHRRKVTTIFPDINLRSNHVRGILTAKSIGLTITRASIIANDHAF